MAVNSIDGGDFPQAEVRYATPGPVSTGSPEHVAKQRADLGLPPMNDDGTAPEATPAEVRADEKTAPVASEPIEPLTPLEKESTTGEPQAKVVESPEPKKASGRSRAQSKG